MSGEDYSEHCVMSLVREPFRKALQEASLSHQEQLKQAHLQGYYQGAQFMLVSARLQSPLVTIWYDLNIRKDNIRAVTIQDLERLFNEVCVYTGGK